MTYPSGWIIPAGRWTHAKTGSSRCATVGSATAPRVSEQTVMPNWAAAIICGSRSRPYEDLAGPGACRSGSIWLRRTDTRANSAPTKKPLARTSNPANRSWISAHRVDLHDRSGPHQADTARRGSAPPAHGQPPAGSSALSPTAGIRPSRSATSPATVSYGPSGTSRPMRCRIVDAAAAVGVPGGPAVLRRGGGEFGASCPSCSSRTSPTISSTMSSRVTTPAVPPYSSTTTAMGCSLRSWSSRGWTGQGLGDQQRRPGDTADGGAQAVVERDGQRVLEVDHADDFVDPLLVDREAGQAGGAGEVDHVLGGGRRLQRADLHARGHDVLRGQLGERQRPYEEVGGVLFQGAGLRGVPGQRDEFAGGAGGGQLLGGLHAHGADQAVGDRVQRRDDRPEQAGEPVLRAGDEARDLHRLGDRPVLGHEFADDHLHGGGQQHADDHGDAGDGAARGCRSR